MKKANKMLFYAASNLGPYHLIRFNTLVQHGIALTIVQTPIKEFPRPWQFDAKQAAFDLERPYHELNDDKWATLLRTTRHYFETQKPDIVVLTGYNRKFNWAALYVCHQLNIPVYLYLVGWAEERSRSFFKETIKQWMCRYFNGALVTGVRAQAYAEKLGINPDKVWRIGNVVDNDHFSQGKRHSTFLPEGEKPYFLVVSRLSSEKNLERLLQAFTKYKQMGGLWSLVIAGTGPEEEKLKLLMRQLGVSDVQWVGWVSYEDLPGLYAHAGCFILPSIIEPWGLVVNEAMAAGLPVLVSRTCGCVPELCWRGINGYDFDPTNVEQITSQLYRVSSGFVDLEWMRLRSRSIIKHYSLDNWTAAILDMLSNEVK